MPTVKCPKCATLLKVQPQATAVKIKCPKCATILQIPGQPNANPTQPAATQPAPGQAPARPSHPQPNPAGQLPNPAPSGQPVAGNVPTPSPDPFGGFPAPEMPAAGGPAAGNAASANPFDFGNAAAVPGAAPAADPFAMPAGGTDPFANPGTPQFGGAVNPMPGNPAMTPHGGGVPAGGFPGGGFPAAPVGNVPAAGMPAGSVPVAGGVPAGNVATGNPTAGQPSQAAPTKSKKTGMVVGIAVGAVVLLALIGGGVFYAISSSGGSDVADAGNSVEPDAPGGFKTISVADISAAVPNGEPVKLPNSGLKARAVQSEKSGAIFYIGVGEFIRVGATDEEVALRVGRYMMSNVYGSELATVGEIGGVQGRSHYGLHLPDMEVHFFHVDNQVKIFACGLERPPVEDEEPPSEVAAAELQALNALFESEKIAFFNTAHIAN